MTTCPSCQAAVPTGAKFCRECGAGLSQVCRHCGAPVSGGKFCDECGQPLSESAEAATLSTTPSQPVAERRVCSVLFADLVGFTPLSEARDPEEIRELLTRYFASARTIVGRYGGVVEKFIGDAVMAVWGTPAATEEDAERAVRAGLDIVEAVQQLGVEVGMSLAARAGVVTGQVAVTIGAQGEGMVAGDAVNTAARVQSVATAGSVLVDATTHRMAVRAIGFTSAGDVQLKGKAEAQQLWQVTRVLSGVGGSQRVDGLEAALVGRDAESRTIKELFHAASDRKVPRMVVVSGPAGVGKSRLGWEFEKYVDGLADTVLWHLGRCLSYGEGVAFWALAEMVRQRLGIAEEDPIETAASKLSTGIAALGVDAAEAVYIGVRLGVLLGVPYQDQPQRTLSREELFAGWRIFFARLAAEAPVVMLIEDAQHADPGLLDFLDDLIDWTRDLPIYLIIFTRPELDDDRPGFGIGPGRTRLTIDPLDPESMETLVETLVPGMPTTARDAIVTRAEGLPLFAVETIRSLIDRDVVTPHEGVYRFSGELGDLDVPDTLHALLAARLDALSPDVRRLVADAAVLGSSFPADALAAVSDQRREVVDAALRELVRRQVLVISADPLSPERGSYRFSQDMLRQVAYDVLSRRDRKTRHLVVAAHLRVTFPGDGEEVIDVIARHYHDALEAVPDDEDVETLRTTTIDAYVRAAQRALRTGAPGRAASNYAAAAQLAGAEDPEARPASGLTAAVLWELTATSTRDTGAWAASVAHADHARDLHELAGDQRGVARADVIAGRAYFGWGRFNEARPRLTAAVTLLSEELDEDLVIALIELGTLETLAGGADGDRITAQALRLAGDLGARHEVWSRALSRRGIFHVFNGERVLGAMYHRAAVREAELADDGNLRGMALLNLADAVTADDATDGIRVCGEAVDLLRRAGNRDSLPWAVGNLAYAQVSSGDWAGAGVTLDHAINDDDLGSSDVLLGVRSWLAALRGEVDIARTQVATLMALWSEEDPQILGFLALINAFIAQVENRHVDALDHARRCLSYADAVGIGGEDQRWAWPLATRSAIAADDWDALRELTDLLDASPPGRLAPMQTAERKLVRAQIAAQAADPAAAPLFVEAMVALRTMSTPYHLAHGLIDHAEHLAHTADPTGAHRALIEAREIAERLGCEPLRRRLDVAGVTGLSDGAVDAERSGALRSPA